MLGTALLLFFGLLAEMTPLDPAVHPDDLISVSCFDHRRCLFLDSAYNLLFSPDGGKTLEHRTNHRAIGLVKIRFSGMIDGWGLDGRGRVWHSVNGGRTFTPVSLPDKHWTVDLSADAQGVWLATVEGKLVRVNSKARVIGTLELPGEPVSLGASSTGRMSMLSKKDRFFTSADGGSNWNPVELSKKAARLGDFLADGRQVAFDGSGGVLLGNPESGEFKSVALEPQDSWSDVSRTPSGLVLVGPAGSRISLTLDKQGRLVSRNLGRAGPGVSDLQFLDRRNLVVAYRNGEIRTSSDGGAALATAGRLDPGPNRISFVDPRRGFALVGSHLIMGTGDGGRNWHRLGYWDDLNLSDLHFADRRRGWAVGRDGCIVSTRDAGQSWTIKCLPIYAALNRIYFTSARDGWIIGDGQTVFRTQDGGRSWVKMHIGKGALLGIFFITPQFGWAVGDSGAILHTADGGESWTPQAVPTDAILRTVVFIDRLRGLAAGDQGRVLVTNNGGKTWKLMELSTRTRLTTAACHRKSARCLIGGEHGLMLAGSPFRYLP